MNQPSLLSKIKHQLHEEKAHEANLRKEKLREINNKW